MCTTTSVFRENVILLYTKPRCYNNLLNDIEIRILKRPIDEITQLGLRLYRFEKFKICFYKIKIPNSTMKESARGGYRVIVAINENHKTICFAAVFPKKGHFGKADISKEEYLNIYKVYLDQEINGKLGQHNIDNFQKEFYMVHASISANS